MGTINSRKRVIKKLIPVFFSINPALILKEDEDKDEDEDEDEDEEEDEEEEEAYPRESGRCKKKPVIMQDSGYESIVFIVTWPPSVLNPGSAYQDRSWLRLLTHTLG